MGDVKTGAALSATPTLGDDTSGDDDAPCKTLVDPSSSRIATPFLSFSPSVSHARARCVFVGDVSTEPQPP